MKKIIGFGLVVLILALASIFGYKFYQDKKIEDAVYLAIKDTTFRLEPHLTGTGLSFAESEKKINHDILKINKNMELLNNIKSEKSEVTIAINYLKISEQVLISENYSDKLNVKFSAQGRYIESKLKDLKYLATNLGISSYAFKELKYELKQDFDEGNYYLNEYKKSEEIKIEKLKKLVNFIENNHNTNYNFIKTQTANDYLKITITNYNNEFKKQI